MYSVCIEWPFTPCKLQLDIFTMSVHVLNRSSRYHGMLIKNLQKIRHKVALTSNHLEGQVGRSFYYTYLSKI